jgi:peptide/nickel transport system permease protein
VIAGRLLRILVIGVLQIVIVSLLVFLLLDISPGNPAQEVAGQFATPAQVHYVAQALGLDKPLYAQYWTWLSHAAQLNFGQSLLQPESVWKVVLSGIPVTVSLVFMSMVLSVILALIFGTAAALAPEGILDRVVRFLSSLAVATPGFWLALVATSLFAVRLHVLPAVGYVAFTQNPWQWFLHLLLPTIALAGVPVGELTRQVRGAFQEVLGSEYLLAARAKGIPRRALIYKHALKNAMVPVITVLGVRTSHLLGGTVVAEAIFNLPGVGNALLQATLGRDIPVVLAVTVLIAGVVTLINVLTELSQLYLSPKVRLQ